MKINKRPERIKSDVYRLKKHAAIDSQNGRNGSIGLTLASNIVDRKQPIILMYHISYRLDDIQFYLFTYNDALVCTGTCP